MGGRRQARAAAGRVRGGLREQPAPYTHAAPAAGLQARLLLRLHVPRLPFRLARQAAARLKLQFLLLPLAIIFQKGFWMWILKRILLFMFLNLLQG